MVFNLVCLVISGLVIVGLFMRTILVVVHAKRDRDRLREEMSRVQQFMSAIRTLKSGLDKADTAVLDAVKAWEGEVEKRTVFAEDRKEVERGKIVKRISKYPFMRLSDGKDSAYFETVIGEDYVATLWKVGTSDLGSGTKDYVSNLYEALKKVHLQYLSAQERVEVESESEVLG